ncbi:MAG: hypothetical protein LBS31_12050 [Candidatus Adiutrix sp.]|nr:hypothetical protein [Candidatus Adiutrix sp.]
MRKAAMALVLLAALSLTGCIPPDVFTPYMMGQQAALEANERDRQQAIAYDISYFNQTGDYGYLCHAAALGSREAAIYLQQKQIGCRYQ